MSNISVDIALRIAEGKYTVGGEIAFGNKRRIKILARRRQQDNKQFHLAERNMVSVNQSINTAISNLHFPLRPFSEV